jgi:hypothetical protein
MDRKELKELLKPFEARCAEKGKSLAGICVEDAFPGDSSTSFIVQVKAPWADNIDCSHAIDFLFDVLWETTDEELRKKIFFIQVIDSRGELHCVSEAVVA